MKIVKGKIGEKGTIQVPREVLQSLQLQGGEEIEVRVEGEALVIQRRRKQLEGRKKLTIKPEIIDELVEREEQFEPELSGHQGHGF